MCLVKITKKYLCTKHLRCSEVLGGKGVVVSRIVKKSIWPQEVRRKRAIGSMP